MITVVIPSRNRPDLLKQCITNLRRHCRGEDAAYNIVVCLTGDGEACEQEAEWLTMQASLPHWYQEGGTFGQAVNKIVGLGIGDRLLLLNNDVIVQDDIVKAFEKVSEHYGEQAIVGARLLYPDGLVQHGGVGFDMNGSPYNLWRYAPAAHPEVLKPRALPAVTFACALVPRDVWDAVGPLDEGYTNAFEDVDWCLRAREQGYSIIYAPSVSAVHLEGQTAGRNDHVQESWNHYQDVWIRTGRVFYALGTWPFSVERK